MNAPLLESCPLSQSSLGGGRGGGFYAGSLTFDKCLSLNRLEDRQRLNVRWLFSFPQGEWVSMGVPSDGSLYGIPADIIYSVPVRIKADHSWEVVQGLAVSDFARGKMDATASELVEERDMALSFLTSSEGKL